MVEATKQFLRGWRVWGLEALPAGGGVQITFGMEGYDPIRFRTQEFAVGKRNARTAALARFASHSGYGDVEDIFDYLCVLPSDLEGDIFPLGPLVGSDTALMDLPSLRCLSPGDEPY